MNVAKVNRSTGTIENLEVVRDEKWIEENSNDEYIYVPYSFNDTVIPKIGLSWTEQYGFEEEQPPEGYVPL